KRRMRTPPMARTLDSLPAVRRLYTAQPVHGELQKLAQSGGFDALIPSPECATSSSYSFILIGIVVRLAKPGGLRSVVAESVLVRHQLLILNRGRKRAPKLRAADRIITGLCTLFIRPARLVGSAIVLKLSTLLYFHNLLRQSKYRMLFSPKRGRRPGPKGP